MVVFQSILRSTGSLPLAMQALWTVVAQRTWYNFAPQFEVGSEAEFTVFWRDSVTAEMGGGGCCVGSGGWA